MTSTASRTSRTTGVLPTPLAPTCPDSGIPAGSSPRSGLEPTVVIRSLSIVLPCFNEEANVADAIRDAASAAAMTSEDYEIIVVDDGSTDDTARIAGALAQADARVRLILHAHNRGYGEAVRSGISLARMDWVLLTDGDLQFDLRELEDFVPMTRSADALVGWRIMRRDTIRRRLAATAWNRLVRGLFRLPVRDVDCAFKLIRRDILQRFDLTARGTMVSTELIVHCRAEGARFTEIGVHHHARIAGEGTGGSTQVVLRTIWELVALYRPLRRLSRAAA